MVRDVRFVPEKLALSNALSAGLVPKMNLSAASHGLGTMIGALLGDSVGIPGEAVDHIRDSEFQFIS